MRRGGFLRGGGIFFIILMIVSGFANVAAAETNYKLNRTVLTIEDTNITAGKEYNVIIKQSGIDLFKNVSIAERNGTLIINNQQFIDLNIDNITISLNPDTPLTTSLFTEKTVKNQETTAPTPPPSPKPTENVSDNSIFGIDRIYVIIIGLFMAGLAIWFLLKKDKEENSEQEFKNPSALTLNKMYIDLVDESGVERIKGAKIKAVNKKGTYEGHGDLDLSYFIELPKGSYKIDINAGEEYEPASKDITIPSADNRLRISLTKRQLVKIEVTDESDKPISGINVTLKEKTSNQEVGSPTITDLTDNSGTAKFYVSRNKQYLVSVLGQTKDFVNQNNIPLKSMETTNKIQLFKKAGTLEITVQEQSTGKSYANIPITVTLQSTSQSRDLTTDSGGKITVKLPVGNYLVSLKSGNPQLFDPFEKQVTIVENGTNRLRIDFKFNYQPGPDVFNSIGSINDKLKTGFKDVSAYDTCIPLFFKTVGEKPIQLVDTIINKPSDFIGTKTSPNEIIRHILGTSKVMADEISRIMREKSNVDFYFSIRNLQPVESIMISDYSQEKFRELVRDSANYHKKYYRDVANKLDDIDKELTRLSGTLTIQPVADLWRVAQKLQEYSMNEADANKRGVILFLNDKFLDHIQEMYKIDEVKARLKFSML